MKVESERQVLDILAPELSPEEAARYRPAAQAQFAKRAREHEQTKAQSAECRAVGDENKDKTRFLASESTALAAERNELSAIALLPRSAIRILPRF